MLRAGGARRRTRRGTRGGAGLVRRDRLIGLADQMTFAAWSALVLVAAGRSLPADRFASFSVVFLISATATHLSRAAISDPLVFVPVEDARRTPRTGGVRLVVIVTAFAWLVAAASVLIEQWLLAVPVVIAAGIGQDSMRALAAAHRRPARALASDLMALIGFASLIALDLIGTTLSLGALLLAVAATLTAACLPTGSLLLGRDQESSVAEWWRSSRKFALAATLAGSADLLIVNGCFALPALLGNGALTAALTAGRTFFAVPVTLVSAVSTSWSWTADRQNASLHAIRPLFVAAIAATAMWAAAGRLGGSVLASLFGPAGAIVVTLLPSLALFHGAITISIVGKAALRVAARPSSGIAASWTGNVALIVVVAVAHDAAPNVASWAMAAAFVPVAVGYCSATMRVLRSLPVGTTRPIDAVATTLNSRSAGATVP